MKNLSFSIVVILTVITMLCSCQKAKNEPVYITDEMKRNFNFDIGTYWVYYDSLKGETDSLVVFAKTNNPPFHDKDYRYESIYIKARGYGTALPSFEIDLIAPSQFAFSSFSGSSNLFQVLPPDTIDHTQCVFIGNYFVGTTLYENVYKKMYKYIDTYPQKNYVDEVFYFNSDFGIIAIVAHDVISNKKIEKALYLVRSKIILP